MFNKALGQYVIKYDTDLSFKSIPAAADKPIGSFVKSDGAASTAGTATSFYGLHGGNGQVFYSMSVLNAHGITWPDGITEPQKTAAIAELEKKNLVIRG